ncbi:potassium channel [Neofusicoccum parvum]|nr:potassium channel [Neofusicoccum parvum]
MNDPGIDEPISNATQDLEQTPYNSVQKEEEEEEQDFLDPSRWWFASTACPLIAGTFGPLANAFSICALVVKWRVEIPPGMDETAGTPVEDPAWLIAVNSISLVCALTANFALLLNMARRLPFNIAQPITIGGFFLASVLLIALAAVASSSLFRIQPADAHALSQAYYYGIIAAALYAIISMLMVLTVYGAWNGHYRKEFRLTISQRTLMLQTISFTVYLLLGGLVFSYVEDWDFLDGVYWADYTLLTVGLGSDFPPKTHLGRGLLFPFAIGGILMALYFSYTSLLTIGYGDYYPKSNSGKPFFVVWSIIAVPTLTILISNMGDTVVKSFSELTIWLGSLTVLPQESGFRATLKSNVAKLRHNPLFQRDSNLPDFQEPPGFLRRGKKGHQDQVSADMQSRIESAAINRLMNHLAEEELAEAEEAGQHGDPLVRDIHFYHYVLATEMRKVMRDVNASPPKQYSYQEWAYYLRLVGQDEANPSGHRKPLSKPKRGEKQEPDIGAGAGTMKFDGEQAYAWSWLGTRSPLMGSKSEAEWILERLSKVLEHELRRLKSPNSKEKMEPPPISMADLRKRNTSRSASKSE